MSVIDPQAAAPMIDMRHCSDEEVAAEFRAAATKRMREIEKSLLSAPIDVLRDAHRRMAIEAHNAEVERKKAEKKAARARTQRKLEAYRG